MSTSYELVEVQEHVYGAFSGTFELKYRALEFAHYTPAFTTPYTFSSGQTTVGRVTARRELISYNVQYTRTMAAERLRQMGIWVQP